MYSCKLTKATLELNDFKNVNHASNPNKESFALKNFRLLTSHLKSRNHINTEEIEKTSQSLRPKTTPNSNWNFMNFEERKQIKSPPNIEKTLQRLNIRSFNNILRSNSMKKRPTMAYRNTIILKPEIGRSPKSKKLEFYTLEKVKYNNYKYQKIGFSEENKNKISLF